MVSEQSEFQHFVELNIPKVLVVLEIICPANLYFELNLILGTMFF